MLYAIMATDVENSLALRKRQREVHLQRLRALQEQGRLVLAGPHPALDGQEPGPVGFTGSLVVAEFESLQQAREWADQDPYVMGGVFAAVVVKPFKKVLP